MMQQYRELKARDPGGPAAVPDGRLLRDVRRRRRPRQRRSSAWPSPPATRTRALAPPRWRGSPTRRWSRTWPSLVQAGVRAGGLRAGRRPPVRQGDRQAGHRPGRDAGDPDRGRLPRPQDRPTTWRPIVEVTGQARPGVGRAFHRPILADGRRPDRAARRDRPARIRPRSLISETAHRRNRGSGCSGEAPQAGRHGPAVLGFRRRAGE